MTVTVFVQWPKLKQTGTDARWAYRFCKSYTVRALANAGLNPVTKADAADLVLSVAHPLTVLTCSSAKRLLAAIHSGYDRVAPLLNSGPGEFIFQPEYPYVGLSSFESYCEGKGGPVVPTELQDDCVLVRTKPEHGNRSAFVHSACAHRFDNFYDTDRDDLVQWIPADARTVLDIGCAYGGYGRSLSRLRPDIVADALEVDAEMARAATPVYRSVYVGSAERDMPTRAYDLINCGDLLEHLVDPWSTLETIREAIRPRGYLVGSVPNASHWSVIGDLLADRFDYIPVGITCVGHLRWYTLPSLSQMLEDCGFHLEKTERQSMPAPPDQEAWIAQMVNAGIGKRESLLCHEIVFRARRS